VARLRGTTSARLTHLLRRDLDWIVLRCLESDRAHRYQSIEELVVDLRRHLHREPVIARPTSRPYVLQQWIRRRGRGLAARLANLGAVVLGAIRRKWRSLRAAGAHPSGPRRPTRPGASSARR
jgi:hypothetical protein